MTACVGICTETFCAEGNEYRICTFALLQLNILYLALVDGMHTLSSIDSQQMLAHQHRDWTGGKSPSH
jgi:hypothetical protein